MRPRPLSEAEHAVLEALDQVDELVQHLGPAGHREMLQWYLASAAATLCIRPAVETELEEAA